MKTKTLGKLGDWSYGIFDDKNYFVAKVKSVYREGKGEEIQLREAKYYGSLVRAVGRVLELASNDSCDPSLPSLVERYTALHGELCEKMAAMSQISSLTEPRREIA
jgi:hypothetical protein